LEGGKRRKREIRRKNYRVGGKNKGIRMMRVGERNKGVKAR